MNGFTWYTRKQDGKCTVQNSGVTLEALSSSGDTSDSYYGWIEEIWELDYVVLKIPVFSCKWIENRHGVRRDKDGFTLVNFDRLGYQHDPFILAKQAKQVFYVLDPADKHWHVVLSGKRRIVGVENVVDEGEYDQFDDVPAFSTGIADVPVDEGPDPIYARHDHQEEVVITKKKRKRTTISDSISPFFAHPAPKAQNRLKQKNKKK